MRNQEFGLIIIGVTILIGLLAWSYENTLNNIVTTTCSHGASCPMYIALDTQRMISTIFIIILLAVSTYLILYERLKNKLLLKKIKLAISGDEKKVYEYLLKNDNQVLQAEIRDLLDTTKVRTTRILKRLEKKGLIEKKRKGLQNLVVLKMKLVS